MQRDDQEDACAQVTTKCGWPKAGWPCVEQVHGPRNVQNQFQTEQFQSLSLLPWVRHVLSLH